MAQFYNRQEDLSRSELGKSGFDIKISPYRYKFNFIRFFIYFLINYILWPFIKVFIRIKKIFRFIFLVYPGTLGEVSYYVPGWFRKHAPGISIIGTIWSKNPMRRGIVVTIPFPLEELTNLDGEKNLLKKTLNNVIEFSQSIGVSVIAPAGRLPSLFLKHKMSLESLFVKGDKGTVFTIIEVIKAVIDKEKISVPKTIVGLVGIGFIGRSVLYEIQKMGFKSIIGIDSDLQKISSQKIIGVYLSTSFEFLSTCDLVLILTRRGEDISKKISYLKSKTIIIDDTYPPIPKNLRKLIIQDKQTKIYRSMLELPGTYFKPALPGYPPNYFPGCVIEAMVVANGNNSNLSIQEEFNIKARELGFKPVPILF